MVHKANVRLFLARDGVQDGLTLQLARKYWLGSRRKEVTQPHHCPATILWPPPRPPLLPCFAPFLPPSLCAPPLPSLSCLCVPPSSLRLGQESYRDPASSLFKDEAKK
ncbi:hypothetical protein E2C01_000708 [Portunus trituberculatus]|uniref:Uncharacterized protein n=1 Tax=Portunus trituberculatus TaxID=210409 RepID=A0A5B7CEU5_PORTR|nr:hypothetical protein [Portunus trituberculatus]